MIFACRIKDGKASFSNRYVKTNRLQQEKKAGHPLGLKVNSTSACCSLSGQCMPCKHGLLWTALASFSSCELECVQYTLPWCAGTPACNVTAC